MADQVTATVDAEQDFINSLDNTSTDEEEETTETVDSEEESPEEESAPSADETAKYKITVKSEDGKDEDREVTLDELAKGYMLQADYTRKTQETARKSQEVEARYVEAVTKAQQSAVESIGQLQELVLRQAAPELNGVDWVALSVQDPAKFVALQAKQQQLQGTFQALEQQKTNHSQQLEQQLEQALQNAIVQSNEYLSTTITGFDDNAASTLLKDLESKVGWKAQDIRTATRALVQAGMHPKTLGQVLALAHDGLKFRSVSNGKKVSLQKVAKAPVVIKPSAPQPKAKNKEAVDRLRKFGRGEDFMRLL